MNRKILLAITGRAALFIRQIISKLLALKDQWQDLAVVATDNAKEVWKVEMQSVLYNKRVLRIIIKRLSAPCFGSGQYDNDHCPVLYGNTDVLQGCIKWFDYKTLVIGLKRL